MLSGYRKMRILLKIFDREASESQILRAAYNLPIAVELKSALRMTIWERGIIKFNL